jgi:hypothetical protein
MSRLTPSLTGLDLALDLGVSKRPRRGNLGVFWSGSTKKLELLKSAAVGVLDSSLVLGETSPRTRRPSFEGVPGPRSGDFWSWDWEGSTEIDILRLEQAKGRGSKAERILGEGAGRNTGEAK